MTLRPFLLSSTGSDRATAYSCSNKVVTLQGKTHVIWTDSIAQTCGRTFDHGSGQWQETVVFGDGTDNHNSPSLTADAAGKLRLAYGPHGPKEYADGFPKGEFKYALSDQPNTLSGLEQPIRPFGFSGTYACLLHTARGYDCIVYRGGVQPRPLLFQKVMSDGTWSTPRPLMHQDVPPEYTNVGAMIGCSQDGTLYVVGHYYYIKRGHSLGVAVLRSTDDGETWTDLRGNPVETPVLYDPQLSVPHPPAPADPRIDGMEVDRSGRLWVLTSAAKAPARAMMLSVWEHGEWRTTDLTQFVPADLTPVNGALCVDSAGRIHIACTTYHTATVCSEPQLRWWSHRTLEVAHLMSRDDGKTFAYCEISPRDAEVPNWLPSISRSGPYHPVEKPVILYTHGETGQHKAVGDRCRPDTKTDVYCVMLDDLD